MLAAQINHFGGPDVLEVVDVPRPAPGSGQLLIAVEASSINGHDTIVRSGGLKFVSGRRFPIGLGLDFVGTVAETGAGASRFTVGDRVWGTVHPRKKHVTGSAAEMVVVAEDRVGIAPAALSAVEAASLVVVGTTALIALRDVLRVQAGQRLLVRGASGGVGTAAVQLARARGVTVTTLAGARHEEQLRALGADEMLDRAAVDVASIGRFDGILDLVGTDLGRFRRTLDRRGRMVLIALSGAGIRSVVLSMPYGSRRIRAFSANPNTEILDALAAAVDAGDIRPAVASVRPLAAIAAAHHAFEHDGAFGKHVLDLTSDAAV